MNLVQRVRRLEARSTDHRPRHAIIWTAATPWQQMLGGRERPIRRGEAVTVIELVGVLADGERCPEPADHEQNRADMRAWLRNHEGVTHGAC